LPSKRLEALQENYYLDGVIERDMKTDKNDRKRWQLNAEGGKNEAR
jgi:hypothetical protein